MLLIKIIKRTAVFSICIYLTSCQKAENDPISPTLVPSAKVDSTFLLTSITGNFGVGDGFKFEYDSNKNLTKFYNISREGRRVMPFYVMYKNGVVSHIIAEYTFMNLTSKASMVFEYGINKKCTKVYFKNGLYDADNDSPYFTNLTDGQISSYDSLIYSSTGQLLQVNRMMNQTWYYAPQEIIKFYYANSWDTSLYKMEEYNFNYDGTSFLKKQFLLTANSIDNPVSKNLWFSPFLWVLSANTASGGNLSLPIIFDGYFSSLDLYVLFAPKCIEKYEIYHCNDSSGSPTWTTSALNYNYSIDSLLLKTTQQGNSSIYINYNYTKIRR